jgi:transcriptional regulator with XRE-family HTH domain
MTFAERLAELMNERGVSGRELGRRVPCDRSYVSMLAAGTRRPSPEMAARLDALLSADGELAALAAAERPDPVTAVPAPAGHADARYVESLREGSQALVRLDTLYGGGEILPLALRAYQSAAGLLATGRCAPGIERDLLAAAGEAGEVAAWIAYDADRQDLSRQLINEALVTSRLAGDRDMELMQFSHLAMQGLHLGRPAESLRIAEHALGLPRLVPRVTALFELRRGRALAQLGELPRGLAAIDRAAAIFADGTSPEWAWWVDSGEVLVQRGMTLAEGGDWHAAVPVLEAAAASRRPGTAAYTGQARLLDGLARVGAWADAAPVIGKLTGMAGMIASPRTAALLRKTTRRIAAAAPPPVAAAARELAAAVKG